MTRRVVYIMSLGHSGSTLLELLINLKFRDVTSLGEVYQTYLRRTKAQRKCTCEAEVDSCDFWKQINFSENQQFESFYQNVLGQVQTPMVTDSSKSLAVFKKYHLQRHKEDRTLVIFLRKGLNAYRDSFRKKGKKERNFLKRLLMYNLLVTLVVWVIYNSRISNTLKKNGGKVVLVEYEDLCNNTETVIQKIAEGFNMVEKDVFGFNEVHQLRGNEMRFDFCQNPEIRPLKRKNEWDGPIGKCLELIDSHTSKKWNS